MGVIIPLLAEIITLCGRMPEGRAKREMVFFEQKLTSIREMVSSLHAVKMSYMKEEDMLLKRRWAKQAREISYDTQDFIDLFGHSTGLSDDTAEAVCKTTVRLKKLSCFCRRPKKIRLNREMTNKIHELKARMDEVIERHKRFKLDIPSSPQKEENHDTPNCSGHHIQSEASSSSSTCVTTVSIDAHISVLYTGADGLVGIDGPKDELTALLMDGNQQTKVVSVMGPEGVGKTTLAKEVYYNIQGKFECCAFVSMSQKTEIQEILQAIQSQLCSQECSSIEACQEEEERLTHKLIQVLKGKRYPSITFTLF
ncbi:hypothetical protein QYE76_006630 [Lolium multiflorum]|uniref:NB-ARC domain-containing protein n=1 Tax=Lolium multiflorum TaxID=4521 RepID=A0AAD8RV70_LOLMU|nr:hypothetical protein QYE76_006630 [Lolium multiflorum]